jgi:hypothetical protein
LRDRKLVRGGKDKPALTRLGVERLAELLDAQRKKAALDALPTDLPELVRLYGETLERLDLAVHNADAVEAQALCDRLELLQERANGGTRFGMATDESPAERLRAETASPIGVVPGWAQRGVFRLFVEDVPHIVTHDEHMYFAVHAEDPDEPFLSGSGYRSFAGDGVALGVSVREQAEAYIREAMVSVTGADGKPRPRKAPTEKPQRVYRMPDSGIEPVVAGGDFFAEEAEPAFEDTGTEIPPFLPPSQAAPPPRPADDDLDIPAFLRRTPASGVSA